MHSGLDSGKQSKCESDNRNWSQAFKEEPVCLGEQFLCLIVVVVFLVDAAA